MSGCDKSGLKRDFAKLNSDQKAAVLKVIAAEDFALIQGLPGTDSLARGLGEKSSPHKLHSFCSGQFIMQTNW